MGFIGAGFLRKFGAEFFVFFSGFHLPERRNVQTDFWCADFGCADSSTHVVQIFCAQIFDAKIFAQMLQQIFCRLFFSIWVLYKLAFWSCAKMHTQSAEKSAASQ